MAFWKTQNRSVAAKGLRIGGNLNTKGSMMEFFRNDGNILDLDFGDGCNVLCIKTQRCIKVILPTLLGKK